MLVLAVATGNTSSGREDSVAWIGWLAVVVIVLIALWVKRRRSK
ncbi:LPXTG cell wall anchor domain-containing protein [Modestobacter marinus]|nr:LPXTG cell wall anchor domain-containing protein [Modestobacter marinus]